MSFSVQTVYSTIMILHLDYHVKRDWAYFVQITVADECFIHVHDIFNVNQSTFKQFLRDKYSTLRKNLLA